MGGRHTLDSQQDNHDFAEMNWVFSTSPCCIQLMCFLLSNITPSPAVTMTGKRWKGSSIAHPSHQLGRSPFTRQTQSI